MSGGARGSVQEIKFVGTRVFIVEGDLVDNHRMFRTFVYSERSTLNLGTHSVTWLILLKFILSHTTGYFEVSYSDD